LCVWVCVCVSVCVCVYGVVLDSLDLVLLVLDQRWLPSEPDWLLHLHLSLNLYLDLPKLQGIPF
jgi:hypothetical protein